MTKNLTGIYALAVCFICAVVFISVTASAIYSLVRITAPDFTLAAEEHQDLQSNQSFVQRWPQAEQADEAALTELRLRHYHIALGNEVRTGWQSLLRNIIAMVIAGLLFRFHWRIARQPPLSDIAGG